MNKQLIIIFGAPRSGLSVLAGCLRILGFKSLDHNSQLNTSTINSLLLQDLGYNDFSIGPLPEGWLDSKAASRARDRINDLLKSYPESNQPCFITDALLCRTLPLWLKVFKENSIEPKYICIVRHPFETAMSLQAHHGLDIQRGHILWLAHTRAAMLAFEHESPETGPQSSDIGPRERSSDKGHPERSSDAASALATFITFDQLLADPITPINSFLDQPLSSFRFPPTANRYPLTSSRYPLTSSRYPLTSSRYPLTSSRQPLTASHSPLPASRSPLTALLEHVQPSLKHHHAADLPNQDKQTYKPYEEIYNQLLPSQYSALAKQDHLYSCCDKQQEKLVKIRGDSWTTNSSAFSSPVLIDNLLQALAQKERTTNFQSSLLTTYPVKQVGTSSGMGFTGDNNSQLTGLFAQVIFPSSRKEGGIVETIPLIEGQWQKISLPVSEPELLSTKSIQLYPLNCPGSVSIASIKLIDQSTKEVFFSVEIFENDNQIQVKSAAIRVPSKDSLDLLITDQNSQVELKELVKIQDCPLLLQILLKVNLDQKSFQDKIYHLTNLKNWKFLLNTSYQNTDANNLIDLSDIFENAGCKDEADALLNKAIQSHPEADKFHSAFAELYMKRKDWPEAIRRWQDIIAKYGENTSSWIYQRLDEAYKNQKSFPMGSLEEEARIGDGEKHEMLSLIHQKLEPELYLEIGVQAGKSLALAQCEAIGIDPMPQVTSEMRKKAHIIDLTSDDFFKGPANELLKKLPDLVFIDGMHLFEYALRDFINVERYSAPHTLVIIDDIFPSHPAQAERRRRTRSWTGDVWKLHEILKNYRPDLFFLPINISPTGLLFIAGLDPDNKVLLESYEAIVSKYKTDMQPPQIILQRQGVYPSGHEAIPAVLETLKAARRKPDLTQADIVEELKATLFTYEQPVSP